MTQQIYTKPRGTITIRNYTMPSLTLDETIQAMEAFFQKTAAVPDLLTSDSYEDFLLYGNVLFLLETLREWAKMMEEQEGERHA